MKSTVGGANDLKARFNWLMLEALATKLKRLVSKHAEAR